MAGLESMSVHVLCVILAKGIGLGVYGAIDEFQRIESDTAASKPTWGTAPAEKYQFIGREGLQMEESHEHLIVWVCSH